MATGYSTSTTSSTGGVGFIPTLSTSQPAPVAEPQKTEEQIVSDQEKRSTQLNAFEQLRNIEQAEYNKIIANEQEKLSSDPNYSSSAEYKANITNATQLQKNIAKLDLQIQAYTATKVNEDGEEEDKFDLTELALITSAVGAGLSGLETLENIINGDDIDSVDIRDELLKSTEAMTDPKVRQMIINASYGDQQALTDLENLTTYGNQFGSLSSDVFNGQYGEQLEQTYQEFLKTNPGIGRDQFLVEFARQNPTSEISQDINQKLSRFGQLARGASEFGQIDRNTMLEGFQDASKFYQPVEQGGYGFTPDQFRSNEQTRAVNNALGLADGPEAQLLRQNAMDRVRTGGKLGTQELQQISADSLASVDPSLQAQPYIRSGGLAQSMINTEQAQRQRALENESALYKILQADRNYAPAVSNVINSTTLDPVSALGLAGKNSAVSADQTYRTNPTTGLSYDPTNAFATSVAGQNANIAQANQVQPSTGSNFKSLGEDITDLDKTIKELR
jgi:hypothetical protein